MKKPFAQPIATLFLASVLTGAGSQAVELDPERYLGHLVLEQTTLLIEEAVGGLEVPWAIETAPDGSLWYTQHAGTVHRYDPATGSNQEIARIPEVLHKKSLGLLGMALHPHFEEEPYVFLHYTYLVSMDAMRENTASRLVRYTYQADTLADKTILLDAIPGKSFHNGSRIVATEDGYLFLSTGDAGDTLGSLDPTVLSGKILRLKMDGAIPEDNPFPGSPVWSIGWRNAQGLALGPNGALYASDHGPNNDDEVNRVYKGQNYGWPRVEGYIDLPAEIEYAKRHYVIEPMMAWTPTIATAGLAYYGHDAIPEWKHNLLLAALKGRAFRALALDSAGHAIEKERIYFQTRFGRIRDICVAADGSIYFATSNRDWHPRYQPWMYDELPDGLDRIVRMRAADADTKAAIAQLANPIELTEDPEAISLMSEDWSFPADQENLSQGEALYLMHCAACHLPTGQGMPGFMPPLVGTDWVTGDKSRLIQLTLRGLSEPIEVLGVTYEQEMPSFATRSDEEIAAILTYIRNAWGNNANAVIPAEVYEERKMLP